MYIKSSSSSTSSLYAILVNIDSNDDDSVVHHYDMKKILRNYLIINTTISNDIDSDIDDNLWTTSVVGEYNSSDENDNDYNQ